MDAEREFVRIMCKRGHFEGLLRKARLIINSREVLKEPFQPDLSQPMHYAAALGGLEVVRELVELYRCDPMCRNEHGITPLHCASYCAQLEVVKYLLKFCDTSNNIIVVDKLGVCPLSYCIYGAMSHKDVKAPLDSFRYRSFPSSEYIGIAKYLLNFMVKTSKKCTLSPELLRVLRLPLYCHDISLADFEYIIDMLTQLEFRTESMKYSNEIYECVRLVVSACKWEFVKILLRAFPAPIKLAAGAANKTSQSFLRTLFEKADIELIKLFFNLEICKPNLLILKWSIDRVPNSFELVQYILESADHLAVMDKHDKDSGFSCLLSYVLSLYTATAREERLIELIVDYGADGRSRDIHGNTVLHLACQYSATFLLTSKGNIYDNSAKNNNGEIPLHIACTFGKLEDIKLVSSQPGLDVDLKDSGGNTPLHRACKSNWNRTESDVIPCML